MLTLQDIIFVLNLVLFRQRKRFPGIIPWHREDSLCRREMEMLNATFRRGTLQELRCLLANWRYYTALQSVMAEYRRGSVKHISPTRFTVFRELQGRTRVIWRVTNRTEQDSVTIEYYGPQGGSERVYVMKVHMGNSENRVFSGRLECAFCQESDGLADSVAAHFRFRYLEVLFVHGRAKNLRTNKLRQYVVDST